MNKKVVQFVAIFRPDIISDPDINMDEQSTTVTSNFEGNVFVIGFLHVRFREIRQYFISFTLSTASAVSWVKLGAIQFASCDLSYNE
jgi:hypothetical protein